MVTLPLRARPVALRSRWIDLRDLPARFMAPGELEALIAIIRLVEAPRAMLEIGCHQGRTAALCLREIASLQRYVGVDVLPGYRPALAAQRGETSRSPGHHALHDTRFQLLLRPRGSLDLAPADIGPVDVAFIDGDHGVEAVRHDTALARAVVRPGGVVIWHDYGNPAAEVTGVIDDEIARGHDIRQVKGTWLAFEEIGGSA
jgi:predicted O-methyltransferase YrrM